MGCLKMSTILEWIGILIILLILAQPSLIGLAKESKTAQDPIASIIDADPVELARVVDRLGDQVVQSRLDAKNPIEHQLAAVRAARWMSEPEICLGSIAIMAVSRDSELAPSAARAALTIATELSLDELTTREFDPQGLKQVRAEFSKAADNPFIRKDIRLMAAQTSALLAAVGVP